MPGFLLALLLFRPGAALADEGELAQKSTRARQLAFTGASMSGAGIVLLRTSAALSLGARNREGCVDHLQPHDPGHRRVRGILSGVARPRSRRDRTRGRRERSHLAHPLLTLLAEVLMIRTLSLLALFASVPGCIFVLDGGKDCDASASGSVSVSVSASDAGDVSAAVVSFAPAGQPEMPCDAFGATGEYVCGWEVAGDLLIRVEAPGYQTFEETVFVEQGECHVVQEHLAVVLAPEDVDCTDVEMPSVIATVAGSSGEALADVSVSWGYRDADMAPQPCDERGDATWACGAEVAGDLEIYADAGGHAGEMASVHVAADECHVITESVAFELDWLPD